MKKKQSPPVIKFKLGDILHDRGLPQRKAAVQCGISKNGMSILCGEPTQIRIETIAQLCHGLDLSPADLFEVVTTP